MKVIENWFYGINEAVALMLSPAGLYKKETL